MPPVPAALRSPRVQALLWIALYGVLAVILMGEAGRQPWRSLVGLPTIDSLDTVTLRALVPEALVAADGRSTRAFFPAGVSATALAPNLLDHLSALPLVWALPFPLADNLWWWLILVASGVSAHALGRELAGSHQGGLLAGLAWLSCEALAREANLHHAPQAMIFVGPLLVLALVRARSAPDATAARRHGLWAGLFLALGALSYWYLGLFLALGTLPLWLGLRRGALLAAGTVVVGLCAPALVPQLLEWDTRPLTAGMELAPPQGAPASFEALPEAARFEAWHGRGPSFLWSASPADTSNRSSLILAVAAVLGALRAPRQERLAFGSMALLGAVMVLGPALRLGDELVLLSGRPVSLPFAWLGALHPVLDRLTWPERWGLLVPLGLIGLAARAPRAALLAPLIFAENVLLSENLPLAADDWHHRSCWRELAPATGAVLELPLGRHGVPVAAVAAHTRLHRRPMVNPLLLPPSVAPPPEWTEWAASEPLVRWLGQVEGAAPLDDPGAPAVRSLRAAGVSAIAMDVEPGGRISEGRLQRMRTRIARHLGPPIDLGCAWVWWLDTAAPAPRAVEDGRAWRAAATEWKRAHPAPALPTLIAPAWDALRAPERDVTKGDER